ncbi:hypothetical protein MKZ38_003312 [Zalerion maritima]|uniref:Uncharacterized protein n=1 Tax=Zalerion maritima TaxID=339359 RepID=A0AAD5RPB8_9PEZI|nr:hypothetical protein MKZ38_003312 [Zalerion maritima]
MTVPAAPAVTTVRGFTRSPAPADEGWEIPKIKAGNSTPNRKDNAPHFIPGAVNGGHSMTPINSRRGRPGAKLDDVVSANCSPILRGASSPAVGGIAKLRSQLDKLDLNNSSRASSPMARSVSRQGRPDFINGFNSSRPQSRDGRRSSTESEGTTAYEIPLEHEFVSSTVGGPGSGAPTMSSAAGGMYGAVEGGMAPKKMTAEDFEPLRCLGKGAYGTVLLVKQRTTRRLYAQKQFKKASMVVHKRLIEQTKTERQILESVSRYPFVVKLYYAFQDHEKLYLILEYGQGGELFTHLNTEHMFSESVASFYMAEMVLALSYLHDSMGVIYRDLKPENCLLDAEGHLLLTDFGLSKVAVDESCTSMSGTVEYMAPEIILKKKYGKAVDWWSFGVLGYDLMTGNVPFRGPNIAKIQSNILKQKLVLPYFLSPDAKDLLTRLLRKEPAKRLGANMPRDLEIIKKHRFFRKIDWKKLANREADPPIQPMITDPELAENFAAEFTDLSLSPTVTTKDMAGVGDKGFEVSGNDKANADDPFGGFSFVASSSLLEQYGNAFPPELNPA